jgi:hypothetical protein
VIPPPPALPRVMPAAIAVILPRRRRRPRVMRAAITATLPRRRRRPRPPRPPRPPRVMQAALAVTLPPACLRRLVLCTLAVKLIERIASEIARPLLTHHGEMISTPVHVLHDAESTKATVRAGATAHHRAVAFAEQVEGVRARPPVVARPPAVARR